MPDYGFSVPFRFPVHFTRRVWDPDNPLLADTLRAREPDRRHRVLVAVDACLVQARPGLIADVEAYFDAYAAALSLTGPPMVVPGGESVKNELGPTADLLNRMHDVGLDRQSFVVAVGGGAMLDMASFAAAIAHRGIRTVRLPTTVLAQADSGVAVKNGLNLFGKKNFIGTFVPPFAVLNDVDLLETLDVRDRRAGIAEVVKVALLKDPALFDAVERRAPAIRRGDLATMAPLIARSAELHLAHICGNGDPFEFGSARPLDFGHWAAHKLEAMTDHRIRHGEAVAIGMALDLTYASLRRLLDPAVCERVCRVLEAIGFDLWEDRLLATTPGGSFEILEGLREFREHLGGELHVTLVRRIGDAFETTTMDDIVVTQALEALARRADRAALTESA